MPPDEPRWWYATGDGEERVRRLLSPLGRLYGSLAERRLLRSTPHRSTLPVICAGNFTAGGTGKTPLAIFLAAELARLGERPAVLTRGYRGRHRGPTWIDPAVDTAREAGDEPLLIASHVAVLVARDRRAGAEAIENDGRGISVIVMDDGLQNPALHKDLKIALVDGVRGVGNGDVIPAGPLRAPLEFQLGLVDCVIVNRGPLGDDEETPVEASLRRLFTGPVLSARVEPAADTAWLAGRRILAYSGIAGPGRFFGMLDRLGADLVGRHVFPDHHEFSEREAADLVAEAAARDALPVTTEKDHVRLSGRPGAIEALRVASRTVPIRLAFDERNTERLRALIEGALKSARVSAERLSGASRGSA